MTNSDRSESHKQSAAPIGADWPRHRRFAVGLVVFVAACSSGGNEEDDSDATEGPMSEGAQQNEPAAIEGEATEGTDPSIPETSGPETTDSVPETDDEPGVDEPVEVDPPAAEDFAYSVCSADVKVGEFRIDVAPEYGDAAQFTSITGNVQDGIVPVQVPVVQSEAGDCRLLTSPIYSCDPTCAGTETCGPDGCLPYPTAHSVGDVTIEGLAIPMTLSKSGRNTYSNPANPMLPHPGLEPEASITLMASGDEYAAFTLHSIGIEPLAVSLDTPQVADEQPVSVNWEAPTSSAPARMILGLNLDNHGVSSARIECITDDDGSHDIPAELVTELMAQGLSGFPSLSLKRQVADSTTAEPGCVQFSVTSELVIDVEVEGLITCSSNEECPDGQECLPNLSCG